MLQAYFWELPITKWWRNLSPPICRSCTIGICADDRRGGLIETTLGADTETLCKLLGNPHRPVASSLGALRAAISRLDRRVSRKPVLICNRCRSSSCPATSCDGRWLSAARGRSFSARRYLRDDPGARSDPIHHSDTARSRGMVAVHRPAVPPRSRCICDVRVAGRVLRGEFLACDTRAFPGTGESGAGAVLGRSGCQPGHIAVVSRACMPPAGSDPCREPSPERNQASDRSYEDTRS